MSETFTNYSPVKINILQIKRVWKGGEHVSRRGVLVLQSSAVKAHLGTLGVPPDRSAVKSE